MRNSEPQSPFYCPTSDPSELELESMFSDANIPATGETVSPQWQRLYLGAWKSRYSTEQELNASDISSHSEASNIPLLCYSNGPLLLPSNSVAVTSLPSLSPAVSESLLPLTEASDSPLASSLPLSSDISALDPARPFAHPSKLKRARHILEARALESGNKASASNSPSFQESGFLLPISQVSEPPLTPSLSPPSDAFPFDSTQVFRCPMKLK
jgi:hypothetical protein